MKKRVLQELDQVNTEFKITKEMYEILLEKIEKIEKTLALMTESSKVSDKLISRTEKSSENIVLPSKIAESETQLQKLRKKTKKKIEPINDKEQVGGISLPDPIKIIEALKEIIKKMPMGQRWARIDLLYVSLRVFGEQRILWDKEILKLYYDHIVDLSEGGLSSYAILFNNIEFKRITLSKYPHFN